MDAKDIPDIYADGANLAGGPFGFTLTLHRSLPGLPAEDQQSTIGARIRRSAPLTQALGEMLVKATAAAEPQPVAERG